MSELRGGYLHQLRCHILVTRSLHPQHPAKEGMTPIVMYCHSWCMRVQWRNSTSATTLCLDGLATGVTVKGDCLMATIGRTLGPVVMTRKTFALRGCPTDSHRYDSAACSRCATKTNSVATWQCTRRPATETRIRFRDHFDRPCLGRLSVSWMRGKCLIQRSDR